MALTDNLVVAYDVIERTEDSTQIYDRSGHEHHCANTGMTWEDGGIVANANSEIGTITNTNEEVFESDIGTAIFKLKSYEAFDDGVEHTIFDNKVATSYILLLKDNANNLVLKIYNGSTVRNIKIGIAKVANWETGITIAIQWRKSSAIYDGKNMAFAIDGAYVVPDSSLNATALDTFTIATTATLLNNYLTRTTPADCVMYHFSAFKRILSAAELLQVHNDSGLVTPPNNLIAAFRMKEAENSTIAKDCSGNKHHMVVTNATFNSDGLLSNANNEYAELDNTSQAVVNCNKGTIIIHFTSLSAFADGITRALFGSFGGGEGSFALYKDAAGALLFYLYDDVGQHYVWIATGKVSNWQTGTQIAVLWDIDHPIYNSDNIVFNIDGSHVVPDGQSDETSWNSYNVNTSLYVGNNENDQSQYANGAIGYLYIFDNLLPEYDINQTFLDREYPLANLTDFIQKYYYQGENNV